LGLEVAVDDAVIVQVDEGVGDLDRESDRGRHGEAALAPQAVAEQLPLDVLHRQVETALRARAEDLDDGRMIQTLPDLLLAAEALVEDDVARVLEMRDLERDRVPVLEVARPEDGRHAAARDDIEELVLVDGLAGGEVSHRPATLAVGGSGRQAPRDAQRPNRHQGRAAGGGQSMMAATCALKLSSPPSSRPRRTSARQTASGGCAPSSSPSSASPTTP